ncbi:hypothetical protein DUZ99_14605 [Xylanibacillus composti]|nr:hypothetical protein [Xylanibacillus composti]
MQTLMEKFQANAKHVELSVDEMIETNGGSKWVVTTMAIGEEDMATTLALGEEGEPVYTTMAVGEEDSATTMAIGEE